MAAPMEFWGVEVKGKEPCKVTLPQGSIIHLSQATFGESKKDKETVIVHVKVGDKKLVLGMLSQETPHLSFDLVFDEEFEISHNWKNGSVHLLGYQSEMTDQGLEFDSSDDEDEEVPVAKENGQAPVPAVKAPAAKPKAENKPKPEEKDDSDEDDSAEDDLDSADEDDSDEELGMSDSDDEEELEDEKPAAVADTGKKRPNADAKTPPKSKKAKIATPQKTDAKKGVVHPSTPHPSKKGGKTPVANKSPASASGGSNVSCGSCKKTFKSDVALQSHSKDKHGAK
ncbi:hypothetical protein RND81_14G151200 [Saponaria officinalis]|uniref:C2H2-type domain-containing protein n=1 Tax=Saponaria officinalis TaxID=3572 RepID=A0AAW1GSS9_SAPOF